MLIAEQIKLQQPQIYNFLIDCFEIDMAKIDREEPIKLNLMSRNIPDPEDDYEFRKFQELMQERSSAQK